MPDFTNTSTNFYMKKTASKNYILKLLEYLFPLNFSKTVFFQNQFKKFRFDSNILNENISNRKNKLKHKVLKFIN